jgi:hypothetical protein
VGEVLLDLRFESVGTHAEPGIGGDVADIFAADADGQRAFIDGRVGVLGLVENQRRMLAGEPHFGGGQLARGEDRVHAGGRGGVVDDAEKFLRQPQPFAQPAQRDLFELGGGRAGFP